MLAMKLTLSHQSVTVCIEMNKNMKKKACKISSFYVGFVVAIVIVVLFFVCCFFVVVLCTCCILSGSSLFLQTEYYFRSFPNTKG